MRKEVYVDIFARHVHLRPQDVETLFGPGAELTLRGQDNFMGGSVYTQRQRSRVSKGSIPKVTILGPLRKYIQVEVSATDARKLGIPTVVRESGPQNHEGTPGCRIVGPCGSIEIQQGVIAAHRHIHMTPQDAADAGVQAGISWQSASVGPAGRPSIRMCPCRRPTPATPPSTSTPMRPMPPVCPAP